MTPFEAVYGKKPDLREVKEWGERVWVKGEDGDKLGGYVREGRWMGIDETSKGCRVYWPDRLTVTVERNSYFNNVDTASGPSFEGENEDMDGVLVKTSPNADSLGSPSTSASGTPAVVPKNDSSTIPATSPSPNVITTPETSNTRPQRARRGTAKVIDILEGRAVSTPRPRSNRLPRGIQAPSEATPTVTPQETTVDEPNEVPAMVGEWEDEEFELLSEMALDWPEEYAMAAEITKTEALEPKSLSEAKKRPDWPLWEQAIREELSLLETSGTWVLTELPAGANLVGSKWVFKAKKDAEGNVVRYKARLVAQGFSQVPGVDYFDTYAPVARLQSIRTVLAFAAARDLEIHQIDIKGAYLNGILDSNERIYMRQPPGYAFPDSPNLVCHLQKTLYGLKQSGRRWYQRLVEIMADLKFTRCEVDHAVFFRRTKAGLMIVLVHVDDCSIVATSLPLIVEFKAGVQRHVEITDLGEIHWLLGLEIRRDRQNRMLYISQRSYIDSIIRQYGLDDLRPVSLPMDPNIRLTSASAPSTTAEIGRMARIPYREAVGSLMFAALGTRPDISFAVQTVSRYSNNPAEVHWEAVKRIFRYLKGTKDLWIAYGGEAKDLVGFADADGSMAEDRRAISGYAFILNGGAVSWSAKRQEIVSLSTTESEYVAATHAAKEGLWLCSLITELFNITLEPTTLFSDNQSAIALTKDHQYHPRTKHIDIRFHFIRWIVEEGKIRLVYCPTEDMVADALTKALPSPKVKHFAVTFGLVPV